MFECEQLASVICKMLNAERDFSLLDQRKNIHARLNPNPKITQPIEWKVFMAAIK